MSSATSRTTGAALEDVRAASVRVQDVSAALASATAARDEAIRRALDAGLTVAEVAAASGLSRERVYQVRDRRR
jgi:hypothetical protein